MAQVQAAGDGKNTKLKRDRLVLSSIDRGKFKPPSDVIVTHTGMCILVEIAAMQTDGFKLMLTKDKLIVSGTRQLPDVTESCSYQQVEIESGEFRLAYALPKRVDDERVTADYQNGILRIELPWQASKAV